MIKPNNLNDRKLKKYIVEAGLETPTTSITQNVMRQLASSTVETSKYQPLISKRGWLVLVLFTIISGALMYVVPVTSWQWTFTDSLFSLSNFKVDWSLWKPSKTVIYGIVFVGLFLLQIPILKKLHHKNFS